MSPAVPVSTLLFGLAFGLAIAHFLSLPWNRYLTAVVYWVPLGWCLLILHKRIFKQKRTISKLNSIDVGFIAFTLAALISALFIPGRDEYGSVWRYVQYIPFLMITPYVLGRLMVAPDFVLFARITFLAGLSLLLLIMIDRISVGESARRLPIFGLDDGPLLVGGLLACLLLVICTAILSDGDSFRLRISGRMGRLIFLALIALTTFVLVWIMARGWLIAALVGVTSNCLLMRRRLLLVRLGLLAYVFSVAALAIFLLPTSSFYASILTAAPPSGPVEVFSQGGPILGEAICQPFKDNVDSIAMRWVMYREAIAVFLNNPVWGVGAARFGEYSCTGPGWYPHSTILQGFAELGFFGGGLLLWLYVFSALMLIHYLFLSREDGHQSITVLTLSLLVLFALEDQFSKSYFMAVGSWFVLGFVASLRAQMPIPSK